MNITDQHQTAQPFSEPKRAKHLSPAAAAVQAALLDGLAPLREFAEGAGKSWRTVYVWIAQGLPTVRIGQTVYVPIQEGRAWLLKQGTRSSAPRSAGRPRKAA